MRTAIAIVIQDGNVQIVPRHTMVQVEASTMVLVVRLQLQQGYCIQIYTYLWLHM
jgi:GH25 family lysozyme M1 (1,4-beta-N-acetylmuramidase)